MKILKCHKGVGPKVTGEALVADDNFSTRYDLDRVRVFFLVPNTSWRENHMIKKF